MRILIDTNILIPLEDSAKILDESFSNFIRLTQENQHDILTHPRSIEDINRDKNIERRKSILSRIEKYITLEDTNTFTLEERTKYEIAERHENDQVDNAILSSVFHKAVHLLITEDRGIHKKAQKLGISDSVLYLQQVVDVLKRLHPNEQEVFHPNLKEVFVHNTNFKDPFYDSLRDDYNGFDEWLHDISAKGRKAWANFELDSTILNAILIYKPEEGEIITDDSRGLPDKSIKISTFKVGEQIRGRKIGELLFKHVFEFAYKNGYKWVYLTIHPEKHEFLKDLCSDLGFEPFGIDIASKRDDVYVKPIGYIKDLPRIDEPFRFYRRYSPSIRCERVSKYIIPIQPRYHEVLFPDIATPSLFTPESPAGNTIKKAYLSHAKLGNMSSGDIVLFYRSGDTKCITTLAIVEDYFASASTDEILTKVAKRTVYSLEEIEKMARKTTKVLIFRQVIHLDRYISLSWLQENEIIKGNIQSIREINSQAFGRIMDESNTKNCIIIN